MKIEKFNLDGKKSSIEVLDKIFSGNINKNLVESALYKINANYKGRHGKTKQQNGKDYLDLFSKITKPGFIDDKTKYDKDLLEKVAFGKNVIILESAQSGAGKYNDVFAIRTDDDQPKIVSVMIKENDKLKFETLSKKLPIGEGGKIAKEAEQELNQNNKDEVLIDLNAFEKIFPKYIGEATVMIGGGGKRKSKSRKSKKRRKGRKNKSKKRSKSKK